MNLATDKCVRSAVLFLIFFLGIHIAKAQEEPLYETFRKHFKKESFSLGLLFQGVADFQPRRSLGGHNGFSVSNARLVVAGKLDLGFGYFLQTNFVSVPALLDAKMYFQFAPEFTVEMGYFKAPVSREFLTSAATLDFVNRSRVVSTLVPGRQVGLQFRGRLAEEKVRYMAGMFNGNGRVFAGNDNEQFMFAGRIAIFPLQADEQGEGPQVELGLNGAVSHDDRIRLAVPGIGRVFSGDRSVYGLDLRITRFPYLLSAEILGATLEEENSRGGSFSRIDNNPWGFHLTAGYHVNPRWQLLIRWDALRPDQLAPDSDWIVLGTNLWPTLATEFQLNWVIDTDAPVLKHGQWLLNAQVAL